MHDAIHAWAQHHRVSPLAIADLFNRLGVGFDTVSAAAVPQGATEAAVQQRVRIAAAQAGITSWRNNVGAVQNPEGQVIRFGLCNDTPALNKQFKSSDLIGINNEPITPAMVGLPRGQFWAREVKHADWKYTGTEREQAQLRFGELVIAKGGSFAFTTGGI